MEDAKRRANENAVQKDIVANLLSDVDIYVW